MILKLPDVESLGLTKVWIVYMSNRNEETEKRLDDIFGVTAYAVVPFDRPEW